MFHQTAFSFYHGGKPFQIGPIKWASPYVYESSTSIQTQSLEEWSEGYCDSIKITWFVSCIREGSASPELIGI